MMSLIYCRVSYFLANFWVVMSLKALMVSGEISDSLVIACNTEHLFRASLIYTVLGEKREKDEAEMFPLHFRSRGAEQMPGTPRQSCRLPPSPVGILAAPSWDAWICAAGEFV